jgi:hypothetical protein
VYFASSLLQCYDAAGSFWALSISGHYERIYDILFFYRSADDLCRLLAIANRLYQRCRLYVLHDQHALFHSRVAVDTFVSGQQALANCCLLDLIFSRNINWRPFCVRCDTQSYLPSGFCRVSVVILNVADFAALAVAEEEMLMPGKALE